uniref:Deubiquitinase OTUD6B n=1 Tax=Balaenoptera musculus TaxID=9771 RepID=A0A8C0CDJ0_BALMU
MEAVLTEELDEEEQLVRRHRKEKKELQAKIQGMKNAVPKNDKKRRRQLTEDVAKLEAEMEQKHKEELEQLKLTSKESKIDSVAVNISNLVLENQPFRISKADSPPLVVGEEYSKHPLILVYMRHAYGLGEH